MPDFYIFFGKLATTTTHSKMGQIEDAIAYLKALEKPNYAEAVPVSPHLFHSMEKACVTRKNSTVTSESRRFSTQPSLGNLPRPPPHPSVPHTPSKKHPVLPPTPPTSVPTPWWPSFFLLLPGAARYDGCGHL